MKYDSVVVMSGAEVPWSGGSGHRIAEIRRQFYLIDDDENDIHLRGAYEIAAHRWSPLHRHTFDQIRYQTGGDQTYGKHRWHKGTFGYFPEGIHYGPHESGPGGFQEIDLQFPGPSRGYFGSNDELKQAMVALREKGVKFENGLAVWPDGKKQDSTEACWEHLLGGKVEYAVPRYRDPVFIESQNLTWKPTDRPGVTSKHIGYFNEGGPNVHLVKIEAGASTGAGVLGCAQVRFVVEGEASYDGKVCPSVSFLYYPPGVEYDSLKSETGAEVLVIQLQPPGGEAPPLKVV